MQKIAVLGLGHMGAPIARRLAAHGFPVTAWSRTPRHVEGVTVAATAREAVRDADVVITMLTDGPTVIEVVTGAGIPRTATLVDMSTIGPAAVRDLAKASGVELVDAPVAGSTGAAAGGTLRIFAGGTTAALDRVAPVLATLGEVRRCGPSGSGAAMKVVLNTALVTALAALAEVLQVADAVGVSRAEAVEALRTGPLGMAVERSFAATRPAAHFPVRLAAKDLALSVGGRDLPVAAAAGRHLAAADQEADLATIVTEGLPCSS